MKQAVRRFKDLKIALKELEPYVRDGRHLTSGAPLKSFKNLRSREMLANWLLCAVANASHQSSAFTFTTDPDGGDGILFDLERSLAWRTEHVMIPAVRVSSEKRSIEEAIAGAVRHKAAKGEPYARGKSLVLFNDSGLGTWRPTHAARGLPEHCFDDVWVVGLHGEVVDSYTYSVSLLSLETGQAPTWLVRLTPDFADWSVQSIQ